MDEKLHVSAEDMPVPGAAQGPGSTLRFRVVLNGDQVCGQAASRLELCLVCLHQPPGSEFV